MSLRLRPATLTAAALGAALACWIVTIGRMDGMDMGPGTSLGSLSFFIGVWVTMMAAMMLPSALPMVLLFDRIGRDRRRAERQAPPTAVFVASYLAVWATTGVAAYLADRAIRLGDPSFLAWDRHGPLVAGAAIAAAGVYELTPLKRVCLGHCRGPLHFLLGRWRTGWGGAIAMGAEHAAYCVGCCWALMVILFALGVMSLTWMAVVAAIVFAQKVLPFGDRLAPALAVALVGLGVWVAAAPETVPGLTVPGSMM